MRMPIGEDELGVVIKDERAIYGFYSLDSSYYIYYHSKKNNVDDLICTYKEYKELLCQTQE